MNAKNKSNWKIHPLTLTGCASGIITGIGVIRFAVTIQHANQTTAHVCLFIGGAILGLCILIPVADYIYKTRHA